MYNTADNSDRIQGFYLQIYRDDEEEKVFQFQDASSSGKGRYDIYPNIAGSKVKIGLLSGDNKTNLHLAEVEVFGFVLDSNLLDPFGPQIEFSSAKQSSTYTTYAYGSELKLTADKAIDGNTDGSAGDFIHTDSTTTSGKKDPWWEGQLERLAIITKISVYNRRTGSSGDPGYRDRIIGFYLQIYRDDEEKVFQFQDASDTVEDRYDIYPNIAGSKVKIGLSGDNKILHFAEVEVFGYTLQE